MVFQGRFGEHKQVFMNVINIFNKKVIYMQYNKVSLDKRNIFLQKLIKNNIFK